MGSDAGQTRMPMQGVLYAVLASVLFGLTTPFSKGLLSQVHPILLAGLFYLGSGIGLSIYRLVARKVQIGLPPHTQPSLRSEDWKFLGGAILAGGVIAPAMLMSGLVTTPASTVSLFLNMEGVLTALLAWFFFKEHYNARIFAGMVAIVCGGAVLSLTAGNQFLPSTGILLVLGACLGWALDNNLTRKVSNADPAQIAGYKGLSAGLVNTTLAFAIGAKLPPMAELLGALAIGFLGYGVSLSLYVLALRHIGAARTGAYFAIAPFIGAVVSLMVFREPLTVHLIGAGGLMAVGLWLHLTEHHEHQHVHERLEHGHEHVHDEHHQHAHGPDDPPGEPHAHVHVHERIAHEHPHFPDQHHDHEH
jgi:drug/metabolite transporter (DMT)-like permease